MERAHRLSEARGLEVGEVDAIIDNIPHGILTRSEYVQLFEQTYVDLSKLERARELCIPCV